MLNLIALWKNIKNGTDKPVLTGSEQYPDSTKPGAIKFDETTVQSSFDFDESPKVVFVNNLSDLALVGSYNDLAELNLSPEEEAIRQQVIKVSIFIFWEN